MKLRAEIGKEGSDAAEDANRKQGAQQTCEQGGSCRKSGEAVVEGPVMGIIDMQGRPEGLQGTMSHIIEIVHEGEGVEGHEFGHCVEWIDEEGTDFVEAGRVASSIHGTVGAIAEVDEGHSGEKHNSRNEVDEPKRDWEAAYPVGQAVHPTWRIGVRARAGSIFQGGIAIGGGECCHSLVPLSVVTGDR